MRTRLPQLLTVVFFLGLFIVSQNRTCALAAEVTTVTAEGIAVIQNGNTAAARDSAVNDALRKAVEQAVGTMISAETVAENYTVLRDRVYSKTKGYVRSYDVLSETPQGELYRVNVSAEVGKADIENDLSALGLLMAQKNMPRVMLMVAEQNIGQTRYIYWWDRTMTTQTDMTITENTLMQKLSEKGFNVVDHTVADKHLELSSAHKIVNLSNDAIKKIGDLYNAEVVIYGKAYAKLRGSVMGTSMKSSMANISLRAVNTDNGGVLASGSSHAAAAHPDEMTAGTQALRQVTEKIAADMIDQIVDRWSGEVSSGGMIQVQVSGNVDYTGLVTLKDTIRSRVRGVKTIYQREFSAGEALLDVEYTGSGHDFADAVTRASFGGMDVRVTGATQNSVSLSITGP
ncbi:MAG: flagellar assembly protein T N-terminal domain-containing protein [Thermodesulfobacteriota bacterium]|nr:flagellar assembly protein T N-terminal domain-containing protein [Thermodesulfobacteriota bacterium]